jgi:hypothetical protein
VRIDHRRGDVAVPQKLLNSADIVPVLVVSRVLWKIGERPSGWCSTIA